MRDGHRQRWLLALLLVALFLSPAPPESPAAPLAVTCSPRPPVSVSVVPGPPGRVQATITANGADNTLQQLQFQAGSNAQVDIDGAVQTVPFTTTLPAGTTTKSFAVVQVAAGSAATITQLVVVDACGIWQTFVGGGAIAYLPTLTPSPTATATPTRTATPTPTVTPTLVPGLRFYTANQGSSNVSALTLNASGDPVPPAVNTAAGSSPEGLAVHPSGQRLYTTIAGATPGAMVFPLNASGDVTGPGVSAPLPSGATQPRYLAVNPRGHAPLRRRAGLRQRERVPAQWHW